MAQFAHRHARLLNRRHDLGQHVAHPFDNPEIVRADPGAHPGEERGPFRFAQQGHFEGAVRTHGASRRWRKYLPNGYAHSSLIEQSGRSCLDLVPRPFERPRQRQLAAR